jgi:hypothetical protein
MVVHKGPASLRSRCTRGGSPVAATPIYDLATQQVKTLPFALAVNHHLFFSKKLRCRSPFRDQNSAGVYSLTEKKTRYCAFAPRAGEVEYVPSLRITNETNIKNIFHILVIMMEWKQQLRLFSHEFRMCVLHLMCHC